MTSASCALHELHIDRRCAFRHPLQHARFHEPVRQVRGKECNRELGVLAWRYLRVRDCRREPGVILQPGRKPLRHRRRVARQRHVLGEQRGVPECRVVLGNVRDAAARLHELLEHRGREPIVGQVVGFKRRLLRDERGRGLPNQADQNHHC